VEHLAVFIFASVSLTAAADFLASSLASARAFVSCALVGLAVLALVLASSFFFLSASAFFLSAAAFLAAASHFLMLAASLSSAVPSVVHVVSCSI
jgi:hypothetical protein